MTTLTKEANNLFKSGEYQKALSAYLRIQQEYPPLKTLFDANIALCEKFIKNSEHKNSACKPEIYISLTTISERLDKLFPVLDSLHQQSLSAMKIYLYVSEDAYLLDKGIAKNDPRLDKISNLPLVEIKWTKNTGPFRKAIPFMEDFYSKDTTTDKIFITVDDDTLYPAHFIETLYKKHLEFDCIIAFRGRHITINESSLNPYSKWELGTQTPSISNLPTGKDGILYSTKFFTREFIDISTAVDLSPTADDLWIKWHCALNGVPSIILNPEAATSDYKSFPVVDFSNPYRDVSLFKAYNSSSSGNKNDISATKLESHFLTKYGYNLFTLCMKERAFT